MPFLLCVLHSINQSFPLTSYFCLASPESRAQSKVIRPPLKRQYNSWDRREDRGCEVVAEGERVRVCHWAGHHVTSRETWNQEAFKARKIGAKHHPHPLYIVKYSTIYTRLVKGM